LVKSNLESFLVVCHRFVFYGSKVQWFGGSHAHFDIRRAAERAACHGNGQAKQSHKGKGKE
jgi:hypothetical protein